MNGGFTKGLIIGGVIGASVSMMTGGNMTRSRNRKRMMRNSRNVLRKSGNLIGDVMELFR
jgi:gas vesicle protein